MREVKFYRRCAMALLTALLVGGLAIGSGLAVAEEPPLLLALNQTPNGTAKAKPAKPAAKAKRAIPAAKREAPAARPVAQAMQQHVGYCLLDPETGEILQARGEQKPLIPASVSKVPSSMAALLILGHDHRFVTTVRAAGAVANGELHGDLYLVGGGDPSLAVNGLMDLLAQLREQGVRRVSGRFLYDDSLLVSESAINHQQNEDVTYNPGISALSLEYNRIEVHWGASPQSGSFHTWTNPNLGYVRVTPGGGGEGGRLGFAGSGADGETWRLRGTAAGSDWLPVKNPGLYTAVMFRHLAELQGIALPYPSSGRAPEGVPLVGEHKSQTLSHIVDGELEHSNNLTAELVGMAAAARLTGGPVSTTQAGRVLTQWFKERFPQTDWNGFVLDNSSGLSSESRITPRQMVEILHQADQLGREGPRYVSLLPISGWKGTLSHRLNTSQTQMRVWAKTGTIRYAQALAGTLFAQSGRKLLFAVLASDVNQRAQFDELLRQQPNGAGLGGSSGWNTHAKNQIYSLVDQWVRTY